MDRRQFVKRVAAASAVVAGAGFAGTGFAGFGCTQPPEKKIGWAMGWILWRDFRGAQIHISEAVNNIAELGLDGIEYTPRRDELTRFGFTRESFRDLLNEKNLKVTANYFGGEFHDPERREGILTAFGNTLENLKFYGAKNVVIGPPGRGNWSDYHHETSDDSESEIPEKIKAMAPFLNELGKIAQDEGIEIGIHPHTNTIVENPAEIDLIMELTDPQFVGLVPDTAHIELGGGDSVEIIRKYSSRLNYFHLKDSVGRTFERPRFEPHIREMGKGDIDFPAIMSILKETGFKGWLNIEQDFTEMTPWESATQSVDYINSTLKPIYT